MGLRTISRDILNMRPHKKEITYLDAYEVISRFVDYINQDFTAINNLKRAAELRKRVRKRIFITHHN